MRLLVYRINGQQELKKKVFNNQSELTHFKDNHDIIIYHELDF